MRLQVFILCRGTQNPTNHAVRDRNEVMITKNKNDMSPASRVMTRVGNNSEYSSEGPEEVQQSWDQFTASRGERRKYGATAHPATPGKFLIINTHSA